MKMQNLTGVLALGLSLGSGIFLVPGMAQTTTGSIYGTVNDASGAVIPNATVTAKNVLNGDTHRVQSNISGDYIFPVLEPGDYTVSAQMKGFLIETQTGIRLDANQNVHVSFALRVGSTNETVTVSASTTLVDTLESQLASTIDQRRLEDLPLNGRDAYDLVQIMPGVTDFKESQSANGNLAGDVVGATFSINGLRVYSNSFYLDGANDTSPFRQGGNYAPNPDALLEFRVMQSNFDAEFGTMPGAVVNMITRSGTNSFHGTLYDYLRNNVLNLKNYFLTSITPLKQNQFGANLGGPVYHDKLFFFGAYQGLRVRTSSQIASTASVVPTAAERTGDFTADTKPPVCGAKSYPCGGTPGLIPTAYLDPMVQKILKAIPAALPTATPLSSGGYPAQQTASAPVNSDQELGRGDYQLTDKHRLSVTYFHQYGTQSSPTSGYPTNILGYSGAVIEDAQTNTIGTDTWTISPDALNSVHLYYTGNHYNSANMFSGNTLAGLGATIPDAGSPSTQPNVVIAGYFSIGTSGTAPSIYTFTTFGAGDTFDWTHGKHTVKFGGTIVRDKFALNAVGQRPGKYTVGNWASGSYLGDFLLGKSQTYLQTNGLSYNFHMTHPAIFAQDDWRLAKRLTLNLGLRWEVFPPFHGDHNTGTFVPNVQSTAIPTAPLGVLFNGDPGVPDGVVQTSWIKFAPRVGFAYDLLGNGKTALRGGWGLFYSQVSGGFTGAVIYPIFSNSITLTDTTNFPDPYTGSTTPLDPYPYTPNLKNPTFPTGTTIPAYAPYDKRVPYAMEYNLTLEQQLGSVWGMRISYVGNATRGFITLRDENSPVYSSNCTAATCGTAAQELARRPYEPTPSTFVFNTIDELVPEISSAYNSLQAELNRRFAHDFTIQAFYVWSRDMADGADPTSANTTVTAESSYNFHQDYGKTAYDQRQRFVASYTWVSPDIHHWSYVGKEALSGWQLNGITTLSKGLPENITSGTDTNYDGNNNDRPNLIGNPSLGGGRSRAAKISESFNIAAFGPVPVGTATGDGNTPYNFIVTPGTVETDFSAFKVFPIWRENKLQFRAEAFNLFNNVNLGGGAGTMSSSTFGKISSAGSPRILQFGLKYLF